MNKTIQPAIPEDVREYAKSRGLEGYLEPLLGAVRRVFTGTSPYLMLEEDPDVEDQLFILIMVPRGSLNSEQLLAARAPYLRELRALVPSPRVCEFRLGVEWSDDSAS